MNGLYKSDIGPPSTFDASKHGETSQKTGNTPAAFLDLSQQKFTTNIAIV